jgi:hypothetical protein
MRLQIRNGRFVGTAEWRAPGKVYLEVDDPGQRAFFARFFSGEDAFLTGPVECAEMAYERRDSSPEAFRRAAFQLAAYDYEATEEGGRAS